MFKPKLGFYDGITLFITDPTIFEHCKNRSKEYQLLGNYDVETEVKLWTFKGRYKNFDIETALIGGVRGVKLGGSLHKLKHSQNYGLFLWEELIIVGLQ